MKLNLFVVVALLSPLFAHAANIDWSQQDLYSSSELVENCTGETAQREKCKEMAGNALVELPAYEICMQFKMPEPDAVDQKPMRPDAAKAYFERMGQCVKLVDHKAFAPNALDMCALADNVSAHQSCLAVIADASFNNAAFSLCTESAEKELPQTFQCLNAIRDRAFSAADLAACDSGSLTQKSQCLKGRGLARNDIKECSQRLAEIQSKIEGLASQSSESNLKSQLKDLVDAINQSGSMPAK